MPPWSTAWPAMPAQTDFVRGVVTMLHGLSLQVFAEGVNDERDAHTLRALGVDGLTGPVAETLAGAPDRV